MVAGSWPGDVMVGSGERGWPCPGRVRDARQKGVFKIEPTARVRGDRASFGRPGRGESVQARAAHIRKTSPDRCATRSKPCSQYQTSSRSRFAGPTSQGWCRAAPLSRQQLLSAWIDGPNRFSATGVRSTALSIRFEKKCRAVRNPNFPSPLESYLSLVYH